MYYFVLGIMSGALLGMIGILILTLILVSKEKHENEINQRFDLINEYER